MNKYDIIKQALYRAKRGSVAQSNATELENVYDFTLPSILEKHDWIFSFGYTTNLQKTASGTDIGFRYRYDAPGDIIEALEGNPSIGTRFISPREALRFGYTANEEDLLNQDNANKPILIDGVLYSDVELNSLIYKREVTPAAMSPMFREYLIYELALIYAAATNSKDRSLMEYLRTEKDEHQLAAITKNLKKPADPQLTAIYSWIQQYYTQTRLRY